jgi:hypothetical protein
MSKSKDEAESPQNTDLEKPPISTRRLEANRQNAARSTGPKTVDGKRRSSQNATKLGIFSKHLIITGQEDAREYAKLHAAIISYYQPEGPLEALWADKIAAWNLRLSRVPRHEKGQGDRALANHRFQLRGQKAFESSSPFSEGDNPADLITDDLLLPNQGDLEKLLRYEEVITRHLSFATTELERLQDGRKRQASKRKNEPNQVQ